MDIKEVKDLIRDVLQSDISEFELEHMGTRIRLKRSFERDDAPGSRNLPQAITAIRDQPKPVAAKVPAPDLGNAGEEEEIGLHHITSPIVGTFYRARTPESEPYVRLGDHIHEGSILCLVEAMKLMNEIPSDMDGEIVHIYVENGHAVEYGQKLFGIRPQNQA